MNQDAHSGLAAAIQMQSSDKVADNLEQAGRLIRQAAADGAELVVLPENFAFMGRGEKDKLAVAEHYGSGPMQDFLAAIAAELGIWLIAGSLPLRSESESERVYPACLVYDAAGVCVQRYDKIHLFDVYVKSTGEHYRESAGFIPGEEPRVVDTPLGRVGLSICYDLRFPELYRKLVEMGAEILTVPSAFTEGTGRVHWEALLKARAIENLCHVIAPNQGGRHANGRDTHGHSMLLDPWGEKLASLEYGPGVTLARIDRDNLLQTRENFPCLSHRRL